MSWLKLHDGWNRHPKFAGMDRDARLLWVDLLTYAREQLTDGVITSQTLTVAAMDLPRKSQFRHLKTLVDRGLIHETEPGKQWVIHEFTKWNDDKETVEKARANSRERLRRFREKQASKGSKSSEEKRPCNAVSTPLLQRVSNADVTLLNPTQPNPTQPNDLKIPPGGAGAPGPGLEPEDPEPILTQDPPPPPRRQRANGKQLPMKPAAPKALCWKLWRDMYSRSRRGYGKYVENPASAKAIEVLAERALSEAISELTDRGDPGANPEPLVEEILRHWFASFLRDDGFNDFLSTKRHAVEYLLKSLSEYGLPKGWGEAAKRRARDEFAGIGVAND